MTDFVRFNSNPKKIVDALYIFGMERGRVVGTVPNLNKKEEEVDEGLVREELKDRLHKVTFRQVKDAAFKCHFSGPSGLVSAATPLHQMVPDFRGRSMAF